MGKQVHSQSACMHATMIMIIITVTVVVHSVYHNSDDDDHDHIVWYINAVKSRRRSHSHRHKNHYNQMFSIRVCAIEEQTQKIKYEHILFLVMWLYVHP